AIRDLKGEEFTRDEISDRMGAGTTGEKAVVFSLIASLIRDDLVEVLEADRYRQPIRLIEKGEKRVEAEKQADEDEVKTRTCVKCLVPKPIQDFYTGRNVCKACYQPKKNASLSKRIEAKKTIDPPPKEIRETFKIIPGPNALSEDVDTITIPVPGGLTQQIISGLKDSGDNSFRPWWYQAAYYICEGLRKDGYLSERIS
ncbi:MAG: hypothetical protein ABII26_05645, partial [Pseudomonadota bacterium]